VVGIPIRVCINGYGTIGKRIADALVKTGDFKVVGVSKYSFDYSALIARKKGFKGICPQRQNR
jgi:glyceraldehyde-3-phosphate dehydrogenase (NAD(P))